MNHKNGGINEVSNSLDKSKAFYNVNHQYLVVVLKAVGFCPLITCCIAQCTVSSVGCSGRMATCQNCLVSCNWSVTIFHFFLSARTASRATYFLHVLSACTASRAFIQTVRSFERHSVRIRMRKSRVCLEGGRDFNDVECQRYRHSFIPMKYKVVTRAKIKQEIN